MLSGRILAARICAGESLRVPLCNLTPNAVFPEKKGGENKKFSPPKKNEKCPQNYLRRLRYARILNARGRYFIGG